MTDYYVEIFLGISIGAFITSLIFVAPLIQGHLRTICNPVDEGTKRQDDNTY